MLYRELTAELLAFLNREEQQKNVLLVQGARQVGKTFLVTSLLQELKNRKVISLNLERDILEREAIEACIDFNEFTLLFKAKGLFEGHQPVLFIDEAQESKKLGSFVRFMKEEWRGCSVILSGSSMTKLFAQNTRVPVGRVEYLRVTPLNFLEFCYAIGNSTLFEASRENKWKLPVPLHQDLLRMYDQFLMLGGLPKVVDSFRLGTTIAEINNIRREIYISQKDDFYRKESSLKPNLFVDATKAIANLLGFPFSLTRISQNHRDARQALSLLQEWLIADVSEQRSWSPSSKPHPKAYLYDVGLARQLRETSLPSLSVVDTQPSPLRTALGGLIENAIFLSLQQGKGFLREVSGWKKSPKDPVEVDFIWKTEQGSIPIEVKSSLNFQTKLASSLLTYLRTSGQKFGILVSGAPFSYQSFDDITIACLPFYAVSADELNTLTDQALSK